MSDDTAAVESCLVDLTDVDLGVLTSLRHADLAAAVARLVAQVRRNGCSVSGYNRFSPPAARPAGPGEPAARTAEQPPPPPEGGTRVAG